MISSKNKYENKKVYNQFKNSVNSSNIANVENNPNLEIKSFLELYDQNINEYFDRLDNYDGFFSTQQIESINFENFEEHVFFDSAIEKTNYSFKKIFNDFPYDGSEREVTNYLNGLDGYTRFILKNKHLKNLGYLKFDNNHYVKIVDRNGWLLNDFQKNIKIGILNLTNNFNFSFDFWLYPFTPEIVANQQIIFQKVLNESGFSVFLDNFSGSSCDLNFFISKGDIEYKCTTSIDVDKWSHVNISLNSILVDDSNLLRCQYYINSIPKKAVHKNTGWGLTFGEDFNNVDITMGGGKSHKNEVTSAERFYFGLIDEFRVYAGEVRSRETIALEKDENIFSKQSLKLYFRFNEPSGDYTNNNIILDHSGNKLHGLVYKSNDNVEEDKPTITSLRSKHLNVSTPLIYELLENNPVLFPNFSPAINVQNIIIEEAKNYDLNNPNSFWKLFPKNIFVEGSDFDNIDETYINSTKFTAKSKDTLTSIRTAPNQKMINLLSIWARFFDEFKIYIDSITNIIDVNYDNLNNDKLIDGVLLPLALKLSGFNFREILPYPILEKLKNKNLTPEERVSSLSIRQIQNKLWQRLLINSKDILTSKGTTSSIHSVFNSFGLESSKFISIKEFNGQNRFNIDNNFYSKKINLKEIDFSCDKELFNESRLDNRISFKSPTYNNNLSNNPLNISNEWAVECLYSYRPDRTEAYPLKQSLLRLDNNTRPNQFISFKNPHINIVFVRENKKNKHGKIKLFVNEGIIEIKEIDKVNLLSGELFYLNLQRKKIKNVNSDLTYYEYILTISSVSENFYSKKVQQAKLETKIDTSYKDARPNIFSIGFYDAYDISTSADFIPDMSYETRFEGNISNFRIYKKSMSNNEIFLKCKTIPTVALDDGIESVILNIDLFEKLSDIKLTGSVYEIKSLLDLNHSKLNGFNKSTLSIGSSLTSYFPFKSRKIQGLIQNSEIDFPKSNNFIYINSFESEKFKKQYGNENISNINQVRPDYLYSNDTRLSIDFSLVNFLNQDITKIININKTFTEKLSQASNLFTDSYVDLNSLRDKYFERLEKEINVNDLYQVYKYFDNVLEELLFECIPSKVKYKGFNFVYESHALERHKYQYKMINSNIPVFDETLKHSYHRDLSNSIDHRKTEGKNSSFVEKNKVSR